MTVPAARHRRRYWFVRHGESTANAEGWLAGHRNVPLTARGIEQALRLKQELKDLTPGRVLTSDLERAWQTAALAWSHRLPPPRRTAQLRERNLGAWEGATMAELVRSGAIDVLLSWSGLPPDGESHQTLSVRVLRLLEELDDDEDTLVIAHGGLIRAIVGLVDGVPEDDIGRVKVANTEVLVRDVPVGTWGALRRRIE